MRQVIGLRLIGLSYNCWVQNMTERQATAQSSEFENRTLSISQIKYVASSPSSSMVGSDSAFFISSSKDWLPPEAISDICRPRFGAPPGLGIVASAAGAGAAVLSAPGSTLDLLAGFFITLAPPIDSQAAVAPAFAIFFIGFGDFGGSAIVLDHGFEAASKAVGGQIERIHLPDGPVCSLATSANLETPADFASHLPRVT